MIIIKVNEVPNSRQALKDRVSRAWRINRDRLYNQDSLIAVYKGEILEEYEVKSYGPDKVEPKRVAFELEEKENSVLKGQHIDYPTSNPCTIAEPSDLGLTNPEGMKKLKIYKQDNEFVVERVNEFNHTSKHFFSSELGLFEYLDANRHLFELHELEVNTELWTTVVNFISAGKIPSNKSIKSEEVPSVETTRTVTLTLPNEIWEMIDSRKEQWGATQSATLRMMIEDYFYPDEDGEEE